jgi:hypothetical protein
MSLLKLGAFWALKHLCGMSMSMGKLGRLESIGRYCHDVERMIYEDMIDETRLIYVSLRGCHLFVSPVGNHIDGFLRVRDQLHPAKCATTVILLASLICMIVACSCFFPHTGQPLLEISLRDNTLVLYLNARLITSPDARFEAHHVEKRARSPVSVEYEPMPLASV